MKFELDSSITISNGNFNCYLKNNTLFIPKQIFSICTENRKKSVEDILDLFMSFPGIMANLLNLNLDSFKCALRILQDSLLGQIEECYLVEHNPPQYYFGALPPMNT